ncbi:enolase C-terminal domain-like protein [Actinocorallia libanotica]|uniref:Enolase C-terminal domain-like protein n=1 Tax=Actinocorallia libanotica TaxID=46162 RepID=A0ABP4CAX6_9ACTN
MRDAPVEEIRSAAYTFPTDGPESDGTFAWDSTTIVVVEAAAAGCRGLGYTYGSAAVSRLVEETLARPVRGMPAWDVGAAWAAMWRELRNIGQPGIGAMAVSAVDSALWDLKARLLDVPLAVALDAVHGSVPVYGSGGFTSYSDERLAEQLGGWAAAGIPCVKMKVGRDPERDGHRVEVARRAIGDAVELFVDANGAYRRKEALEWARRFAEAGVRWLEEPVSSDDLEGLRLIRDTGPSGLEIAAGEYGYRIPDFRRLLEAGAVDCLQADVTRCGGMTGFQRVGALADAYGTDLSAHCAPQLSAHAGTAVRRLRHVEYFHDHVRIERLLFDGVLEPVGGVLVPDRARPGTGLEFKRDDAAPYRTA